MIDVMLTLFCWFLQDSLTSPSSAQEEMSSSNRPLFYDSSSPNGSLSSSFNLFGAPCDAIPPYTLQELQTHYMGCQYIPTRLWINSIGGGQQQQQRSTDQEDDEISSSSIMRPRSSNNDDPPPRLLSGGRRRWFLFPQFPTLKMYS